MIDDKQKLLFLMRLLKEETDPAHPMNAAQISEKMEIQYECSYDRKTIYSDVKRLQAYGMKIGQKIRLLKRYAPEQFTFEVLKSEYGIYAIRGPRGVPNSRSSALKG